MLKRARSMCFRFLLLAVFGILLAALYLSVHGLPDGMKRRILDGMQVPGMTTTVRTIRMGLFEGLVATDVCVYRKGDLGLPLLEASELVLHFKPGAWLQGDQAFFGMRIKQGVFRVPVSDFTRLPTAFEAKPLEYLIMTPVNAMVRYERSGALRISDFDGRLGGIHLTGRGLIALQRDKAPGSGIPPKTEISPQNAPGVEAQKWDASQLAKVADFLSRLQSGRRFDVDVDVYIDASSSSSSYARLSGEGEEMAFDDVRLGVWSVKAALTPGDITGSASVSNSSVMGMWVENAQCRFALANSMVSVDGLDLVLGRGRGRGHLAGNANLNLTNQVCSGAVTANLYPGVALPILDRFHLPQAQVIRDFNFFGAPPSVQGVFEFRPGVDNYFKMNGSAKARDLRFRGTRAIEVETDFIMAFCPTGSLMRLSPLKADRWEGSGAGTLSFDFLHGMVTFDLASTMDPKAVAPWIGPFMTHLIAPYRLNGPSYITASGVAGMWDPLLNDIQVEMDLFEPGAFAFDADYAHVEFMVNGWDIDFPVFYGDMADGTFDAFLSVQGPPDKQERMAFTVQGELLQAEFGQVLNSLGFPNPTGFGGRLSGSGLVTGFSGTNWPSTLEGQGELSVEKGRIFKIPLFGGLSELLSKIIPGLNWIMRQTDAHADIVLGNGRARSERIQIEGDVLSLKGSGEYSFSDALSFDFQVRFLRQHTLVGEVVSGLTWPLTKALEAHLGGRAREPRWSLRHLSGFFESHSDDDRKQKKEHGE